MSKNEHPTIQVRHDLHSQREVEPWIKPVHIQTVIEIRLIFHKLLLASEVVFHP
jgi:hypothetical protein